MDFGRERSVEDNELIETEGLEKNGEIDTEPKDNGNYDAEIVDVIKAEGTVANTTEILPGGSIGSSPSPATKGRGLRKWRRIPREAGKETNSSLDSNRKRGMIGLSNAMKQRSEGSSSSTNAMSHALDNPLDHNLLYGDLGRGSDFASRADSDNSEDQNSRSSTAASAPKPNHRFPVAGMKSSNGKNSGGISVQPGDQPEKNQNQTKKPRGFKLKKENSISSLESDSRSSNFVFTQGSNSVTSNGRKNVKLGNYEEDYSDDAENGDTQTQTAFNKNEADSEDVSHEDLAAENSWEVKEEKINGDHDTLVDSIIPLHLAQEALEREVQKLRDVGKEETFSSDDSFQSSNIKIEEARVMIELKNAKIFELESILNLGDIKKDYEELLMQGIAAELEYLVILKTIQNLKEGHMDQINNLMVQQKKLEVDEKVQVEEAWKLKNRVWRYGLCFMIQLFLLLVGVYVFVLQFSSQNKVIPT
ncbi:WPP domain-interacting protein 2 [Lactuca sativa]|uniref:WPP domain-containing protein n=1 Tax=Lactuca sativa TaxID=4236 RepID=A0A9R1X5Y8_LACSA|nr:WPP domain-interacting protein 2 [Lactuca sativa]KAJ0197132.1 hypothetical protein LSAT_V11C700387190 [Lactuca sativa]